MKRSLLIGLALCLMASVAVIGFMPGNVSAQPTDWRGQIEQVRWLNSTYQGPDGFLGNVVAYKGGSSATVVATVFNNSHDDEIVDIIARLETSWDSQKRVATKGPSKLDARERATFEWEITVPATASNLILHRWEVTVQYKVKGEDTIRQASPFLGTNLAVYTNAQAAYQDLRTEWNAIRGYSFWGFEGRKALGEATYEHNVAENAYQRGDFSDAETHIASAVAKLQDAIEKDAKAGITQEEALTLEGTGGVKGLGFLIGGIGILVFGLLVGLGVLAWGFLKR